MGTLVKSDHLQVESLNMSPVTLARVLRVGRALLGRVVGFIFVLTVAQASAETQFVTIKGDLKTIAWWVLADFQPFTTEVRGIPANQIRKDWCKATEFRKDLIPRELILENGSDGMEQAKLSFAVEGHFDGSAATQAALVGVYQECAGKKGRFILIIDRSVGGTAKVRFVNAVETDRQFGALAKGKNNTLVAWACMDCDNYSVLKWNRKSHKFEWLPTPDEE
jgi:hypothetical protein